MPSTQYIFDEKPSHVTLVSHFENYGKLITRQTRPENKFEISFNLISTCRRLCPKFPP